VLLTLDNLANRDQYINARNTFTELLAYGAIPVVNENVRAGGGECGCGWVDLGVWVGGVGVWVWGVEGGMCHAPAGLLVGGVSRVASRGREEADTRVWCAGWHHRRLHVVRDTPGCLYLDTGVAAAAADDDNTTTCMVCLLLLQDTVAVQELRFGDNDTLSAQVRVQAPLVGGGAGG
jgi:hypothetical protein